MVQKVSGVWQGGKKIELSLDPNIKIVHDELGPKATDLVLAGLAGCSAGVFREILDKMRLSIKGLKIDVEAEREAEPPKLFTTISLIYHIDADVGQEEKLIKAAQLGEKYCTVYNIMKQSANIEVSYYINGVRNFPE